MAARSGVTFLASSGDSGSADCLGPDGAADRPARRQLPGIVGVGDRRRRHEPRCSTRRNQITDQVVWNDTDIQPGSAGGGGSSALFRRPFYQNGTSRPRAARCPTSRCSPTSSPATPCSARRGPTASTRRTRTLADRSAAPAPRRRCSPAASRSSTRSCGCTAARTSGSPTRSSTSSAHRATLAGQVFDDVLTVRQRRGAVHPRQRQPARLLHGRSGATTGPRAGAASTSRCSRSARGLDRSRHGSACRSPAVSSRSGVGQILARLTCTGPCRIGAYAVVTIGRSEAVQRRLEDRGAGARGPTICAVRLRATSPEQDALEPAPPARSGVIAQVYGAVGTSCGRPVRELVDQRSRARSVRRVAPGASAQRPGSTTRRSDGASATSTVS